MSKFSGVLDKQKLGMPCPDCGKKLSKSIGWLKTHDDLVCACGGIVSLKSKEVRGVILKAEKELADFARDLIKTSKKLKF